MVNQLLGRTTPEQQVKKWQHSLKTQGRELAKHQRGLTTQMAKTTTLIKQSAKRNDQKSCRALARELVGANRQIERLAVSQAQLRSLSMDMQHQLAVLKITGALETSTAAMQSVNRLTRLPQISAQMTEMAREMCKAGVIAEMVQDVMQDDELEEAADAEVERVLFDVTQGALGEAGAVGRELDVAAVAAKRIQQLESLV